MEKEKNMPDHDHSSHTDHISKEETHGANQKSEDLHHGHYPHGEEGNEPSQQTDHMDHSAHMDHNHSGHAHHGNFKEIFFRSLPLGILILLLSPMMGINLPFQFSFPYSDILVALLSTILIVYGGRPFYLGALEEFKKKSPSMMALVSLGIGVSYFYSLYAVIARYTSGLYLMDFFFEFASLILIMLLGHWIEMKAIGEAGDAQRSLAELLPKEASIVLEDGSLESRPVNQLKFGDLVRIQAGENIPADGIVDRGQSQVNESLLTGESKPITKKVGDQVIGGSTNQNGVLFIQVQEVGEKSFISQVQRLIQEAQNQPSRAENLANKVASALFYIALLAALASFVAWLYFRNLQTAILFAVTTLVIACPHALGLAIPLVVARSTSLGASQGLLVKDREAIELASKADIMVLDKTGTLTTGDFQVLKIQSLTEDYRDGQILSLMAGLEAGSSHPIAQSIVDYAEKEGAQALAFDSIEILSGLGIRGLVAVQEYQLVSLKSLQEQIPLDLPQGVTVSVLLKGEKPIGVLALGDQVKPNSKKLIQTLKSQGIEVLMATGDNQEAARSVAENLGIEYRANQSPRDKHKLVENLKKQGRTVIMVGDGINDAPSLALADVGIAIGAGTQVALDSADVILSQSDPGDIEAFLDLAHKTNRKMKQNLVWGAGYNFVAIPLAAGILAPQGLELSPALGAILMSISTVIVAINAMTLNLSRKK